MDGFLVSESQLIKVEVEENTHFHCIVCKAEFLSRTERNEHLETHFVHRNCKHCCRQVIVIGDLEFELHQPTHCNPNDIKNVNVFETEDLMFEECSQQNSPKYEEESSENESHQTKITRTKMQINYNEETSESENIATVKRMKPAQKVKRKSPKKATKAERVQMENGHESSPNEEFIINRKANTDSDDDVIKEMDVAIKKRRKQYAKLPKTVPCTMCDAMFGTERTLKIHMNQVHGIKEKYICPICSREFKIGGNLKQHIETHSDYKRFICNYCGKGFHLPYNLKEHMNTHTGARPYKCETCGKTFGRNTLRQAHMRIHTGEKPYKCTVENCDRAYAYQTDLKRHRRSVHGIITKTFPCPICSKVFYENKFLTKHLNVHQGNA